MEINSISSQNSNNQPFQSTLQKSNQKQQIINCIKQKQKKFTQNLFMENQNENPVETKGQVEISQNLQNQESQLNNEDNEVNTKPEELEEKSEKEKVDNQSKIDQQINNQLIEVENQEENELQQQKQNPVLIGQDNLNIQEYLEKQLERYKKIEAQCVQQKDKKVIKRIMSTLEGQLEKLKLNNLDQITNDISNFGGISLIKELEQTEESFFSQSKIQVHLKEIYKFYSKIFYVRGPSDDFTRINHESQTLTEGKFMIFCRQFGLIDEKIHHIKTQSSHSKSNRILNDVFATKPNKLVPASQMSHLQEQMRILSFKELNLLFRRINQNQNEITFINFVLLLKELSKLMYKDQTRAEIKLFQYMEVDSTQFKKKMKSLNIPFESKDAKGFRKPEGLQLQRFINYSTDELKSKRILVEEWKNVKKQELRDKIISQADNSRSKSIFFEPSYIKTNNYRERKLRMIGLDANSNQVVNWEKLDKLDPKLLLHEEFKPEDLIEEDEDEDDKYYLRSYGLSRQKNEDVKKISSIDQKLLKYQLKTESTKRCISNISKIEQKFEGKSSYLKLPRLQKK
ncbi:unnamed protein product (macronuclear) [Paramecium tetraurelia]|uniref:EF-hand domain-containing protein n=1 Tax=Paramecium tetraurelia TaxID=5888 RepID=A0ECP2_PARTE|nr:uncharacterized protein GSPATT00003928001 [Paramecium tetraurelia]CAK93059.1 unnamed protein product [Paramecium tetraurelia]|eukprot:XP_001460456.1 hypothetical protein (macronuclear) [Paramecium tetraurelia strain d4-2]